MCDRIGILVNGKMEKIVDQKEWAGREGELEKIFTSTVKLSENIGPIKFLNN